MSLHEEFGGVVPEIASRAHIEKILPVISAAISEAGLQKSDIDAIAVANQPGLVVALIVGVTAAKTLALVWEKPLIAVNHVHAHLQSAMLARDNLQLPAVALIVSGGHTNLSPRFCDCPIPADRPSKESPGGATPKPLPFPARCSMPSRSISHSAASRRPCFITVAART